MKVTKTFWIFIMIVIISTFIVGCAQRGLIAASSLGEKNKSTNESVQSNENEPTSRTVDNAMSIMDNIDARVSWIKENLGNLTFRDEYDCEDYFDGNHLAYRKFYKIVDCPTATSEEDDNEYILYYDKNGKWIYADIIRYRAAVYSMYIKDNDIFHVEVGPFETGGIAINGDLADVINFVKKNTDFGFVLEDYGICLENVPDWYSSLLSVEKQYKETDGMQ